MSRVALLLVLVAACATHDDDGITCTDCELLDPTPDDPTPTTPLDVVPPTLADSGLDADTVHEFQPRWALWSDGAEKRRWISLPAGTTIDTSNPDYWQFPVGTKLWKEFVRDGVRVETRYMAKFGGAAEDWLMVAYEWNAEQTVAVPVPDGDSNVNGTPHDIPAQTSCLACHGNVKSRVLGFSALQLDRSAPDGMIDLDDATAADWLSAAPPASSPHYPLPGNQQQRAVLGYFHANCGHCHNSQSPLINRPMFRLEVNYLSTLASTRTYKSTVNVSGTPYGGASIVAKPGDPDRSIIITRMRSSDPKKRMPWLGGEVVDPTGYALIRAWITSL